MTISKYLIGMYFITCFSPYPAHLYLCVLPPLQPLLYGRGGPPWGEAHGCHADSPRALGAAGSATGLQAEGGVACATHKEGKESEYTHTLLLLVHLYHLTHLFCPHGWLCLTCSVCLTTTYGSANIEGKLLSAKYT